MFAYLIFTKPAQHSPTALILALFTRRSAKLGRVLECWFVEQGYIEKHTRWAIENVITYAQTLRKEISCNSTSKCSTKFMFK